jgi:ANTAR domain
LTKTWGTPPTESIGFTGPAVEEGTRAVFAFPLQVGAARIGTLTLYQDRAGPLDQDTYADAVVMADVVTLAFLAMQSARPYDALADPLSHDGDYRAEIHQATGMVSVQLDINVGEALLRLRARAMADDTTLAQLAAAIITRQLRLQN